MKKINPNQVVIISYGVVLLYWLGLTLTHTRDSQINYVYQLLIAILPIIGGLQGLRVARKWGGLRSKLGKALTFLSAGIVSWGLGQVAWSYYVILAGNKIPFPSLADLGFIVAIPLWLTGIVYLSRTTGASRAFRNSTIRKLGAVLIPTIVAAISYYLLIVLARDGSVGFLALALGLAYPLGDVGILSFALLVFGLSSGYLGGRYKIAIYTILLGYGVMYAADFAFSYTTTKEVYYNGHWVDLLFPTAMALLSYGLSRMEPVINKSTEEAR
jgi:hypothetical protein